MAAPMTPPAAAPAFLEGTGWGGADIRPLAGDASFRRYFRIVRGRDTAVLMDAPPPHEDARPFLAIAAHLNALGLSAPQAIAADTTLGLVLLEDFGDDRLAPLLTQRPDLETPLYETAVDILAELGRHAPPADLPGYGFDDYLREARLFTDWHMPALGLDGDAAAFDAAWADALASVLDPPARVVVLRDYHADNLMLLDRPGLGRLGLLDFQDARSGHPAYDLVSLIEDARRDTSEGLRRAMRARFAAATKADPAALDAACAVLGAQRNTKILGIFTRLWRRDGKPHYLALQPRVWAHLDRDLAHPALAPVRAWFAAHVPAAARAPLAAAA